MDRLGKKLGFVIVVLFLTALLALSSAGPTFGASSWRSQTIGDYSVGNGHFIAIDSQNNPHLVYSIHEYDGANLAPDASANLFDVMYASWSGRNWNIQTVMKKAIAEDFVLDSNDTPHILLKSMTGYEALMYTTWNGSVWSFQTIYDGGAHSGSLAFDANGNPHMAFLPSLDSIYYAHWIGYRWSSGPITSSSQTHEYLGYPFLGFDKNNNPQVIYSDQFDSPKGVLTTNLIIYSTYNGATWNSQTVLTNATLNDVAYDSNGYPHFTYSKGNNLD